MRREGGTTEHAMSAAKYHPHPPTHHRLRFVKGPESSLYCRAGIWPVIFCKSESISQQQKRWRHSGSFTWFDLSGWLVHGQGFPWRRREGTAKIFPPLQSFFLAQTSRSHFLSLTSVFHDFAKTHFLDGLFMHRMRIFFFFVIVFAATHHSFRRCLMRLLMSSGCSSQTQCVGTTTQSLL